MNRRRKGEVPGYRLHKATGQAYCTIGGKRLYLGLHGTPESRRRYRKLVDDWERQQGAGLVPVVSRGCTIAQLVAAWDVFARQHYRDLDGEPTTELTSVAQALRPLLETHAKALADAFRPADLRGYRQRLVDRGLSRGTINSYVGRVRKVFRWGVSNDLVEPSTLTGLESLPDLQPGRGGRETEPVQPAQELHVRAVLSHLCPEPRAMVRLQLLIGCRPGEVCRLRGRELNQDGIARIGSREIRLGGVWTWQPERHKSRWRGKALVYLLGPAARDILAPWLRDDPTAYLFRSSPAKNKPYTPGGYWSAVDLACKAAGIPHWHPNQLRHAAVSRYDREAGIEAASLIVGHERIDTTGIYAERNLNAAAEIVARLG